ncbi:uncharacterized protein LOC128962870 [Oppia nitens]|uniref:uncharacterized protein LOC128962870 n=1 Tax=Oppia nitens TaxID=1686743 RepID=UPI0023DBA54C|nr:uncharacterized protein LOC128962870 [Oppia nitens]
MIGYIIKRSFLLSSASLIISLSLYTKSRQLTKQLPSHMIWRSGRQTEMSNRNDNNSYNNNNNTKKSWIEWLSRAHMFDVDIEYFKDNYKYNVIALLGISYEDNHTICSMGTAVIVDTVSNMAVTNAHVVAGHDYMIARICFNVPTKLLPEQSFIKQTDRLIARVIYIEPNLDLALVCLVEMDDISNRLLDLPIAYRRHELGEQIAILGHGHGQLWTVYVGYIIANTPIDCIGETHFQPLAGKYDKCESFVLHKSNIIPGTSGAALIDDNLEIVAINFATLHMTDKPSLATHSITVNDFLDRAANYVQTSDRINENFNRFRHHYQESGNKLGIVLAKSTDNINTNFIVIDIIDNRMSKLEIDDIILEVNDQSFTEISQLTDIIDRYGEDVVWISRNNNLMQVRVNCYDYDCIPQVF